MKKIKFNKNKILICCTIVLLIMAIALCVTINKKNNISKIETKEKKEEIPELFSYRVLDNSTEVIKGIVNVQSENGIQEIEYPKMDGTVGTTKLQCNGKNSVSIDYNVEFEKEYNFKIITNTGTENKVLKVDSNELDKYINIEKLPSSTYYNNAKIEYNNEEQITKYYKIKDIDSDWITYDGDFAADRLNYNADRVTILGKTVDSDGNTIINEKEIGLTPNNVKAVDVFDDYETYETSQGMTLEQYGFSYTYYTCENIYLHKRDFYLYHGNGDRYFGATLYLDYDKFKNNILKDVSVKYRYWRNRFGWDRAPYMYVTIKYKDGTSKSRMAILKEGMYIAAIFETENKEIERLEFKMDLHDANGGYSAASLTDIDLTFIDE